ncbi:MAG: penicillin acylase family protein [Thermoplasmata archaeon]
MSKKLIVKLAAILILSGLFLTAFSVPIGPLPPIGDLLEPLGGIWTVGEDAVPVYQQTLNLPGSTGPVRVFRDQYWVPHVFADNDTDLYIAVGYLHASDRLFQLDMQRRAATGSLSEVLGPSTLETDKFLRSIGLKYASERTLEDTDNETLGALQAYALGVNAYIGEVTPNRLPLEFKLLNYRPKQWEPLDSIAFVKLMGWSLSGGFTDLELKLFEDAFGPEAAEELFPVEMPLQLPIIPPGPPQPTSEVYEASASPPDLSRTAVKDLLARYSAVKPILGPFQLLGSNNWVVGSEKSATKAPMLANDPHLSLTMPSIWYQVRLSSPSYNVYGVSLLGLPLAVLGFNDRIAWGMTNVGADVVDFFVEEVNPENEMQYLYRGQWENFTVREEVIQVRGGGSVTLQMKISVHGPIVTRLEQTVAMQWTGHMPTSEFRALLRLNKASDWEEFRAALKDFHVPAQNIVYADVEGNIGIIVNGLYPIRGKGLGRVPVDGSSGEYDWVGFVPFEEVPSSFNPKQGFLVSANQKPTRPGYSYYLGWEWADRYRAERINDFLKESDSLTLDDMRTLQNDHFSVAAREFVPFLIEAFDSLGDRGASLHPDVPPAIDLLKAWDYMMEASEVAPSLYWMWLYNYREATFRDNWDDAGLAQVGPPSVTILEKMTKFEPSSSWFDVVTTGQVETRDDIIRTAFASALDYLEEEMGAQVEDWVWGDLHRLQVRHLTELDILGSGILPRDGGSFTVDVAHGSFSDGRLLVTSGPSWRMIVDLRQPVVGDGTYPGGQSGNPLSPHYSDLLDLWLEGDYQSLELTSEVALKAGVARRG